MSKKPEMTTLPTGQIDPYKQKATLAQMMNLEQKLQAAINELTGSTNNTMTSLWHNQKELLQGLGSAELNLRAHQKVLNAIVLELNQIRKKLELPSEYLQLKQYQISETETVEAVNWEAYHQEALLDMEAADQSTEDKKDSSPEVPEGATVFE